MQQEVPGDDESQPRSSGDYRSRTTTHAEIYGDNKSDDSDQEARPEVEASANKSEIEKLKSDHMAETRKLE